MLINSNNTVLVSELDPTGVQFMINELIPLAPELHKDFMEIKTTTQYQDGEILEYLVLKNPVLFGKVYLGWEARDYQEDILELGAEVNKLVLRLGRRLGKTECMCLLILWHSYVQPNKGENDNQYNILIIAPFEEQVDLIFDRLHQLIDSSPIMSKCISRDIHHRLEINNGTIIKGLTAGSKSNTGAASTRGQRADLIVLDEVDYMGSDEITNIINIKNEDPARIKLIVASTPAGKRQEYYQWCTGASLTLAPSQEDIDGYKFSGYIREKIKGNGWVQVYAPSIVNKKLLEINPETEQTYLEDLRSELTDIRYAQEVMAEFGDEQLGVYQKKYIDWAVAEGRRCKHRYTTSYGPEELEKFLLKRRTGPRILGVDWDKRGASTNMVCIELDQEHTDEHGNVVPIFKTLFRVEIPRSEFTYTNAVQKIIELNDLYDFDWIAVDRGSGETQVEMLHKHGMQHPETGLHEKTIGVNFSEKIDVRDPYTLKKDKKKIKPFMVNNSVMVYERHSIMLNPDDRKLTKQFEDYRIKNIAADGTPTYVDTNEHIVDAVNLALFMFERNYGELLRRLTVNKCALLPRIEYNDNVAPRDIKAKTKGSIIAVLGKNGRNGYISNRQNPQQHDSSGKSRRMEMPARRKF